MKKIIFLTVFIFSICINAHASQARDDMKGVWVSTIYNLDFPSHPTTNAEKLKSETDEIINNCRQMGFNTIFFQVRPSSDAFYNSKYFPWSKYLSGSQGTAPEDDFDPLKYWIDKCHENSIELHAWINPYRITKKGDEEFGELAADNPAVIHPEWTVKYTDGNYYYNPAIPEVRELVTDSVREILINYDVDGIHLDDYFYPGSDFDDAVQYEIYNNGEFDNVADWRRNNVNLLVKNLYDTVHSLKSDAVFGISPSGIWDNKSSNPLGSDTSGKSAYSNLYADSRKWVKDGFVDYLAPQVYWEFGNKAADYETVAVWWNDVFENSNAKLYIGLADYRCNDTAENSLWHNGAEIKKQINYNHTLKNVSGEIHFRYKTIISNNVLKQEITNLYKNSITVILNGKTIDFDQPPVLIENRTMVPMRKIFEEFGFAVNWNDSEKAVTASNENTVVKMQIANNIFSVNGINYECDVSPIIINGRTLVPARAISESLDCNVEWLDDTKTVVITKNVRLN